jgi:hypothetical protein
MAESERIIATFTVLRSDLARNRTAVVSSYDNNSQFPRPDEHVDRFGVTIDDPTTLTEIVANAVKLSQHVGSDPIIEFIPVDWKVENQA